MTIIYHKGDGPITWPKPHDPDSSVYYGLVYDARVWEANTVVYKDRSIVKPTVNNGHYYVPSTGGRTGSTEPTWTADEVEDGSMVVWKAYPFDLQLFPGDQITNVDWVPSSGVTIDNESYANGATKCRVTAVPAAATSISLKNILSVLRETGDAEVIERTINIKIKDT